MLWAYEGCIKYGGQERSGTEHACRPVVEVAGPPRSPSVIAVVMLQLCRTCPTFKTSGRVSSSFLCAVRPIRCETRGKRRHRPDDNNDGDENKDVAKDKNEKVKRQKEKHRQAGLVRPASCWASA